MKNILLFDTETTGIVNFKRPASDPGQPHLVQLAALLVDFEDSEVGMLNVIVRPEGFEIPTAASNVHGITTEKARDVGVPLKAALDLFKGFIPQADVVVGHNTPFDVMVLGAEWHRLGEGNPLVTMPVYCTMRESTDIVKLPSSWGYKWPKLAEVYKFAFHEPLVDAHDAMVDLRATLRVYKWLKARTAVPVAEFA